MLNLSSNQLMDFKENVPARGLFSWNLELVAEPHLTHMSAQSHTSLVFIFTHRKHLGFHVKFTWSEALNYIEKREEKIARYKFFMLLILPS